MVGAVLLAMSLCAAPAAAEVREAPPPSEAVRQAQIRTHQPIRDSVGRIDFGAAEATRVKTSAAQTGYRSGRSTTRKVVGTVLGATAGFFAGGYLGAAIEGDCNCDDPGLKGALIGAPIGAITGGILGALFF